MTDAATAHKYGFAQLARQWWAVGVLAFAMLVFVATPWPLLDKLYAIAYGICPQRPAHSLFFGGQQMSIEARMFGMFGGAVAAALYLAARGRGKATGFPRPGILAVLIGFVAWMGLDGVNALLFDLHLPHLYTPDLALRLGTGLLTGLAIGAVIVPAFNQTIWSPSAARTVPALSGWRDLLGVLGVEAVLFVDALTVLREGQFELAVVVVRPGLVEVFRAAVGDVAMSLFTLPSQPDNWRFADILSLMYRTIRYTLD